MLFGGIGGGGSSSGESGARAIRFDTLHHTRIAQFQHDNDANVCRQMP